LLTAVSGARPLRVPFDQFDELIAVLGFLLELEDDHNTVDRHFLSHDSAASLATAGA
jgi:hypothetical protein